MGRTTKREKPPFAKNASARAKELGISGHRLASLARLPYPTVRDVMAGVSPGLEETRIAIAKALDISLADLYRDSTRQRDGQSPTRKVADMTAAELETLIVMAFGHNVEVKTELERLRRENTELKIRSKISHLPFGILPKEERWREDVALYFLTGDPVHLDREVPKAIADRLRRGIQFHGMEPKALSPRK